MIDRDMWDKMNDFERWQHFNHTQRVLTSLEDAIGEFTGTPGAMDDEEVYIHQYINYVREVMRVYRKARIEQSKE